MIWVWAILAGLLACGLYLGGVYLAAWFEVKAMPKGETYICMKHGPIQKESTISFAGVPYCPICFHESLSNAEKIVGSR